MLALEEKDDKSNAVERSDSDRQIHFEKYQRSNCRVDLSGGESGIRTHGPREGSPVFKTGVFNRSTISPSTVLWVLASGINDFHSCCIAKYSEKSRL